MKLTTSLAKIRDHSPCRSGWEKLLKSLGGIDKYGEYTEVNLLTILESNGVQDMLWCLRATDQNSIKVASQLEIEFADLAIQAARDDFNEKLTTEGQLDAAYYAARADYYAARADAYARTAYHASAARVSDVARAAAAYHAAAAARAAYRAAYYDDAHTKQIEIIKAILES